MNRSATKAVNGGATMVEPLYVPVLPMRRGPLAAYSRLAPFLQAAVSPLWTIPLRTNPAGPPGPPGAVVAAQRATPAWVDARHLEGAPRAVTEGLWPYLLHTPLRPVTGPGRPDWQQSGCADFARACGNGLGLRVRAAEASTEQGAEEVRRLVERLAGPDLARDLPVDLLLDLEAVTEEDHQADKCALRALELLGPLTRWRSIVLLAGSFPPTTPEPSGWGPIEAQRHDWDVWHMVRHARPELPVEVTYGDYGAHHAFAADAGAGGGAPWGVLRYTTDRTFLLAKAPTIGDGHAEEVREIARRMIAEPEFRGAGFSEGDRWLHACATGTGTPGVGNAESWIRAGHSQHLAYAAWRLSA
ncbi:hypothetical protein [Streptomyces sp. A1547]|uniref:beta family protein n=1 Tax=Streptomyces sp. A1547 TaxID=2563105 RepID=UPI00144AA8CA|nr:hypothetical protein [Streptomyces sp. A1547]